MWLLRLPLFVHVVMQFSKYQAWVQDGGASAFAQSMVAFITNAEVKFAEMKADVVKTMSALKELYVYLGEQYDNQDPCKTLTVISSFLDIFHKAVIQLTERKKAEEKAAATSARRLTTTDSTGQRGFKAATPTAPGSALQKSMSMPTSRTPLAATAEDVLATPIAPATDSAPTADATTLRKKVLVPTMGVPTPQTALPPSSAATARRGVGGLPPTPLLPGQVRAPPPPPPPPPGFPKRSSSTLAGGPSLKSLHFSTCATPAPDLGRPGLETPSTSFHTPAGNATPGVSAASASVNEKPGPRSPPPPPPLPNLPFTADLYIGGNRPPPAPALPPPSFSAYRQQLAEAMKAAQAIAYT